MSETDSRFYERADEHIQLANTQLELVGRGKVSASLLYSSARFCAWVSACGFSSGEQMTASREETLEYFVSQYRTMLEENLDDYVKNFDAYMKSHADA